MGATGTGKSASLKAELEAVNLRLHRPWVILVDPDNEYGAYVARACSSLKDLVPASIVAPSSPAMWYRFIPSDDRATGIRQFAYLCGLAWIWATRLKRDTLLLVDELAEFTAANEAPAAWRRLVKRGRKAGVSILAASQRPAEIDKTIFSNASRVRVFRLGYEADQAATAAAIGVPRAQVAALEGHAFIEKNALEGGGICSGRLQFST